MSDPDDYNLIQNKLFNNGRYNLRYWDRTTDEPPTVINNGGWDGTNNCVEIKYNSDIMQSIRCGGTNNGQLFISANLKAVGVCDMVVRFYIRSNNITHSSDVHITDQWKNYHLTTPYSINRSNFDVHVFSKNNYDQKPFRMEKLYTA